MELSYILNASLRPKSSSAQESRRKPWTAEEDALLMALVRERGARNWRSLEQYFDGRKGAHLRSHYKHALENADSKRPFTPEEDALIVEQHERLGGRWSVIARLLENRGDIDVKNRHRLLMRQEGGVRHPSDS